ncbi:dTDP-4-dehydrorhamnose 3,5-epimerase [Winogradskyella echinorum]|uniref:dTDP-4-dehydrorhamnose 3,5-epimerase n=1 Tax=Winogradskyella echinorum TaxID=538189 RepID=A0ABR6XZC6_9FLAO|nr:dTDP-4-dehydrorhamnose 3,5-epimerase [Winogradskyella echinorum]MBC3845744.1 dTDP-4-dehydrorhamnose 3,5-epimerase [Winogradskyella echinorum]MBC5750092.1 dTDP-4-dehydrorhamnose 3,5-epimerase [Winogradskyella echinorum]
MVVKETKLKGCFILQPQVFKDKRGYFIESHNQKAFNDALGLEIDFVQDNESQSSKGVLRGLHYQVGDYAQAKLVRVIKGKVLDVVVDLRPKSPTFGEHLSVELSDKNKTQIFIPRGFAHGFLVLEDETIFSYKCDNFYNKEAETGIIYNDEDLGIDWKLSKNELIISNKDLVLPSFKSFKL